MSIELIYVDFYTIQFQIILPHNLKVILWENNTAKYSTYARV